MNRKWTLLTLSAAAIIAAGIYSDDHTAGPGIGNPAPSAAAAGGAITAAALEDRIPSPAIFTAPMHNTPLDAGDAITAHTGGGGRFLAQSAGGPSINDGRPNINDRDRMDREDRRERRERRAEREAQVFPPHSASQSSEGGQGIDATKSL
ncbi:hypothetical protein [Rhodococcus wratislaviensis]|uniref:hypothetical protein n=1 Tax=Rhodococcus wratislaviensis TaxID=44752 RepID=UPI00365A9118